MLLLLLKDQKGNIQQLYERYLHDIEQHRREISWLAKTETLQDSLDTYQTKLKAKKRNGAAAYELALKADRRYQPGDQISYYVIGTKAKVKVNENCKLASAWDPESPDENVEYYRAKLKELFEKFKPWIDGGETMLGPSGLSADKAQLSLLASQSSVTRP
jgi:DNA polymerase elongation subunit (family B)